MVRASYLLNRSKLLTCLSRVCVIFKPHCFSFRCFLTDHSQRGGGNSVERHFALSRPRTQPRCAVHDL